MSVTVEIYHANSIIISLPSNYDISNSRGDLPLKICNRSNTDLSVGSTVLQSYQSTIVQWADLFVVQYVNSEFNLVEKIKDKVHFNLWYRQKTTSDDCVPMPKVAM